MNHFIVTRLTFLFLLMERDRERGEGAGGNADDRLHQIMHLKYKLIPHRCKYYNASLLKLNINNSTLQHTQKFYSRENVSEIKKIYSVGNRSCTGQITSCSL